MDQIRLYLHIIQCKEEMKLPLSTCSNYTKGHVNPDQYTCAETAAKNTNLEAQ
jgi:hypothetical protein